VIAEDIAAMPMNKSVEMAKARAKQQ